MGGCEVEGSLWVVFGRSWGLCGRSGVALGTSVGGLGRLLGHCGQSWTALGAYVGGLGASWGLSDRSWAEVIGLGSGIRAEMSPKPKREGLSGEGPLWDIFWSPGARTNFYTVDTCGCVRVEAYVFLQGHIRVRAPERLISFLSALGRGRRRRRRVLCVCVCVFVCPLGWVAGGPAATHPQRKP